MNSTSKEQLAWVIKILASNKLYAPDLESGAGVDGELSSWLNNMLANGERKEANKFAAGSHMVGYVAKIQRVRGRERLGANVNAETRMDIRFHHCLLLCSTKVLRPK